MTRTSRTAPSDGSAPSASTCSIRTPDHRLADPCLPCGEAAGHPVVVRCQRPRRLRGRRVQLGHVVADHAVRLDEGAEAAQPVPEHLHPAVRHAPGAGIVEERRDRLRDQLVKRGRLKLVPA